MKHVKPASSWGAVLYCVIAGSSGAIPAHTAADAASNRGGIAEVSFLNSDGFADARDSSGSSDDNLKILTQHLQRLAKRYLTDGQVLQVEVLDIDLAGRWPFRAGPHTSFIRGSIDWPRIKLRYVLEANGAVVQRGEENVRDMNFASDAFGTLVSESLPYEKRMLNAWFAKRFVARAATDH